MQVSEACGSTVHVVRTRKPQRKGKNYPQKTKQSVRKSSKPLGICVRNAMSKRLQRLRKHRLLGKKKPLRVSSV